MSLSKRDRVLFASTAFVVSMMACGPADQLCCSEKDFQVGGTITAEIGGGAQTQVAVQAIADFAGIAAASIDEITTACRGIATDLDAPKADQDAAEAAPERR